LPLGTIFTSHGRARLTPTPKAQSPKTLRQKDR